jgi:hypothetical protein
MELTGVMQDTRVVMLEISSEKKRLFVLSVFARAPLAARWIGESRLNDCCAWER